MKLFIISVITIATTLTINTYTFEKAIGSSGVDNGKILLNTSSGYVVIGEKSSDDYRRKELFIYKTDKLGSVLWAKSYGGAETYVVNDAYEDGEGNIHLSAERYINQRETLIYMKLNQDGELITSVPYDEDNNEVEPWAIAPASNRGSIIVGFTKTKTIIPGGFYNASVEQAYLYILKIDSLGQKIWSRKLNTLQDFSSNAFDITKDSLGFYYILGNIRNNNALENVIIKIDEESNIIWSKKIVENNLLLNKINMLNNQGIILGGICKGSGNDNDISLISMDLQGTILWSRKIGKDKDENTIGITSKSDEIIVTGTTKSFNSESDQILVISITYEGLINWANRYGTGKLEEPSNPVFDQNYIVFSGFSLITPNGPETILVKKNNFNNVSHEIQLNEDYFPITTQDININFQTLNSANFGGTYSTDDTKVESILLNNLDINL